MNVAVRSARHADIPAMHAIRLTVLENPLPLSSGISEASYTRFVDTYSAWVAEHGSRVVGFAAIDHETADVWALFVGPNAHRSGVGRRLHERLIEWAVSKAVNRLTLATAANTAAVAFYDALKWTRIGEDDRGQICFAYDVTH